MEVAILMKFSKELYNYDSAYYFANLNYSWEISEDDQEYYYFRNSCDYDAQYHIISEELMDGCILITKYFPEILENSE